MMNDVRTVYHWSRVEADQDDGVSVSEWTVSGPYTASFREGDKSMTEGESGLVIQDAHKVYLNGYRAVKVGDWLGSETDREYAVNSVYTNFTGQVLGVGRVG